MTRKHGLIVYVAIALTAVAATAAAQAGPASVDSSAMFLYGLGIINTLLMALLMFHMNSAAKQRSQRDQEMNESMKSISADLKKLNDAVLGQYVTKDVLDGLILNIRTELKEEARVRRLGDSKSVATMHRFELAMVKHNIAVPPAAADADEEV